MSTQNTQDLGLAVAIISGKLPPKNIKVLWYNENDGLHYYYQTLTGNWTRLSNGTQKRLNKEFFSWVSSGEFYLHEAVFDVVSVVLDGVNSALDSGCGAIDQVQYKVDFVNGKLTLIVPPGGMTPASVYVCYYPLTDGGYTGNGRNPSAEVHEVSVLGSDAVELVSVLGS